MKQPQSHKQPCAICLFHVGFGIKLVKRFLHIPSGSLLQNWRVKFNIQPAKNKGVAWGQERKKQEPKPVRIKSEPLSKEERSKRAMDYYWANRDRQLELAKQRQRKKYAALTAEERRDQQAKRAQWMKDNPTRAAELRSKYYHNRQERDRNRESEASAIINDIMSINFQSPEFDEAMRLAGIA